MKKIYNLLLFTVLAAGLAACSSDEEKTDVTGPAAGNLQIITRTPQAAAGRGAVNTFPGLVHTARHTMGVSNARSQ